MKRSLFSLLIFFSISLVAQNQAKLCFKHKVIDLGELICKDDSIVKINFVFSNDGNAPLVINEVVASCGCVKPKWPKKPIKSGEKSVICLEFNTKGRYGVFKKDVFVESNSVDGVILLKIKGNVKKM